MKPQWCKFFSLFIRLIDQPIPLWHFTVIKPEVPEKLSDLPSATQEISDKQEKLFWSLLCYANWVCLAAYSRPDWCQGWIVSNQTAGGKGILLNKINPPFNWKQHTLGSRGRTWVRTSHRHVYGEITFFLGMMLTSYHYLLILFPASLIQIPNAVEVWSPVSL